jgi:hypothetical protein
LIEERIIVRVGKDQFNVIAGHVLNTEPLTKAEADRLAGRSPVVAAPEPSPSPAAPSPPDVEVSGMGVGRAPALLALPDRFPEEGAAP